MEKPGFIMYWPEIGKKVRVAPVEHNRRLFDWFLENLPTRCVQTTTVVAGLSLYMQNIPVPRAACNWIQEETVREPLSEFNVGRMMFFMTAGHVANICCKVDWVTEPLEYPSWAEVVDEDKHIVKEVGWHIWESLLSEKKTFHVEFIKMED